MKRKDFIRLSSFAAGAWLLTDSIPAPTLAPGKAEKLEFNPDPLLKITESGQVTVYVIKQEMGQNVVTSLPILIAEELEVDPAVVIVQPLPYNDLHAGGYTTWASASVTGSWMALRKVGATAKAMLIAAAANRWQTNSADCIAQRGAVINQVTNEAFPYSSLLKDASALKPPEDVVLKDPVDFKVIGHITPKKNLSKVLTGKQIYTMDLRLPGMLFAALIRCPTFEGDVAEWDTSALNNLPGIVKVLQVKQMKNALNRNAVAIIANTTWAALEAQRLIRVKWRIEAGNIPDTPALYNRLKKEVSTIKPALVHGKAKNELFQPIQQAGAYKAGYMIPYVAHATMEPVNCIASFKNGKFEIWGGFQAPMFINDVLPELFNVKRENILVHLMPMGGSFGRKEKIDNVADAMQLAVEFGVPIQVIFSRADDFQNDFYRHASYHELTATSSPVQLLQWRHQLAVTTFPGKEISGPWHMFGGVTGDLVYPVDNYQSAFYPVASPIPIGSWRSISFSPNIFAIESFIDELAIQMDIDPVRFRLNLLDKEHDEDHYRLKRVILKCAESIGWWERSVTGRHQGFACCMYGRSSSIVAHAFEITVHKDKLVKINRCVAVADCGLVVDPDGLKAQIEGSLVWALSAVFKNEITISGGKIVQQSFADYDVLRMNEMPALEIVLISGGKAPGGGGEPAVPSVGPALCNAIFAATGFRIRELPIQKHGFRLV